MFLFRDPMKHPLFSGVASRLPRQALNTLSARSVDAVVAGGFLRDLWHNRQPKDIDFFVKAEHLNHLQAVAFLRELGFDASVVVHQRAAEYLKFADVAWVVEGVRLNELPIQIIGLVKNCDSAEQVVQRLDLGLCQIGMDFTGAFWCSDGFMQDSILKTMTVVRAETYHDRLRSTQRFNRLVKKYPGFKLVGGL